MVRIRLNSLLLLLWQFWDTFYSNSIDFRIIELHGDQLEGIETVAVFCFHPDGFPEADLATRAGIEVGEAAFFPKKAGMFFA
jgi:hypothetical protein